MPNEELLLPKEAASRLRIDVKTLGIWARRGRIAYVPMPSGHRRYRAADVDAILSRTGTARHGLRMLVWDVRQPIDLDELADAITDVSRGTVHLTQVDTCSDELAIVIAARPVDADEAYRIYETGDSR